MFTATIYKICIASASGAMKEERIAQDAVSEWNCLHGERCRTVFLPVPQNVLPEVYVFVVDNYVDAKKVESVIATGATVVLFFSIYHNPQNTMNSEIESIEKLRERIQERCVCIDYKSCTDFEQRFTEYLNSVVAR